MMNSRPRMRPKRGRISSRNFVLDLVQLHGQLAVRRHARAHHRRHGLLRRRREAVLAFLAVLEVEEDLFLGVARPAARFLPELARLEDRQLDLEASRPVDLLADDLLGLAVRAQPEGREGIDASRQPADHPGARQEHVRDRVGVAGDLADGLQEVSGPAHRALNIAYRPLFPGAAASLRLGPTFSTRRRLERSCCIIRSSIPAPRAAVLALAKAAFASSARPAAR